MSSAKRFLSLRKYYWSSSLDPASCLIFGTRLIVLVLTAEERLFPLFFFELFSFSTRELFAAICSSTTVTSWSSRIAVEVLLFGKALTGVFRRFTRALSKWKEVLGLWTLAVVGIVCRPLGPGLSSSSSEKAFAEKSVFSLTIILFLVAGATNEAGRLNELY